jgi:lysine biosynthesis protein LysW
MENDVYVDCPSCGHTLKVANDLIGAMVECPDCSFEFEVPDIQEGLNPRLRSDSTEKPLPARELPDLSDLGKGLTSLLRRQRAQIEQIEFLHGNSDLFCKQLEMLKQSASRKSTEGEAEPPSGMKADPASTPQSQWIRWSLVCGCVSIGLAVVVVIALLRS